MRVTPVDPLKITDDELAAMHEVRDAALRHDEPDRRRPSLAELAAELATPWPGSRSAYWLSYDGDQPAGVMSLTLPGDANATIGHVELDLVPSKRRLGGGRQLFFEAVRMAYSCGRGQLMSRGLADSASQHFAEHMGCQPVLHENRATLDLSTVDVEALPPMPVGYDVVRIPADTPAEMVAAVADLHAGMVDAPRGGSALAHQPHDVERVLAFDRMLAGRGLVQLRLMACHRDSGEPAGISYVIVPRSAPTRSEQGDTVVLPAHRDAGLGRALKAEMLRWLRSEFPEVGELTTWVAHDNAAMNAVNQSTGYRTVAAYTTWQTPVDDVVAHLGMS